MTVSLAAVYASQVFQKLKEQSKDRLSRGAQLRAAMVAQLAAGLDPTGYRVDFLHATAKQIIDVLCAAAETFNTEHPDDMISTADFLDVLATTKNKIVHAMEVSKAPDVTAPPEGPKS